MGAPGWAPIYFTGESIGPLARWAEVSLMAHPLKGPVFIGLLAHPHRQHQIC